MKPGTCIIPLLLCFLSNAWAIAKSNPSNLEYLGSYGGKINCARKLGSFTYIGQGDLLRVYGNDGMSTESQDVARLKMPGTVANLDSYKTALFVLTKSLNAKDSTDIEIVDINNPARPRIMDAKNFAPAGGSVPDFSFSIDGKSLLTFSGNELYEVYDIANPFKPKKQDISSFQCMHPSASITKGKDNIGILFSSSIADVRVIKNIAYLLDNCGAIISINISSPKSPRYLARLGIDAQPTAFDCSEKQLAVSDENNRVKIYDMQDRSMAFSYSIEIKGKIKGIQLQDPYLGVYTENSKGETMNYVYDISTSPAHRVAELDSQSPYNATYKIGFGILLKYRVCDAKYWLDIRRDYESSLNLMNIKGDIDSSVTQITAEGLDDMFGDVKAFGKYIALSHSYHTSGSDTNSVDLYTLSSGKLKCFASWNSLLVGYHFYVQNDILCIADGDNGLVILKIH